MKKSQYNQVPSVKGNPNVHGTIVPKNFKVNYITSFQNKITSDKSRRFTPHRYPSLIYTQFPLEFPCL